MANITKDVRDIILAEGLAGDFQVFRDNAPDIDDVILIGSSPAGVTPNSQGLDFPRVQIMTRSKSIVKARNKIEDIRTHFSWFTNEAPYQYDLSLYSYQFMAVNDYPVSLGFDETQKRFLFVINYELIKITRDRLLIPVDGSGGAFTIEYTQPGGENAVWKLPPGTKLTDGTPVSVLTGDNCEVVLPDAPGSVRLTAGSWRGNTAFSITEGGEQIAMDVGDLPKIDYSIVIKDAVNLTGNINKLKRVRNKLDLEGCTGISGNISQIPPGCSDTIHLEGPGLEGAIPAPDNEQYQTDTIKITNAQNVDVAQSIKNLARYWNGRTGASKYYSFEGCGAPSEDVSTELTVLSDAGCTVVID